MNQYEQTKKPDENFLITRYISRGLSYPIAILFKKLGVSANAVTILGGICWVASAVTILLAGYVRWSYGTDSAALIIVSAVLWNVGYVLDVADGSLARMTGTQNAAGFYLDFCFHLIFVPMFLCSIGLFLFLVMGHPVYLVLGVLAICANWGVSFSTKEHVLCEYIAKGKHRPENLTDDERYEIFVDSPDTKARAEDKRGIVKLGLNLAQELFTFPGQFTLFSVIILADLLLLRTLLFGPRSYFALTRLLFLFVTIVSLVRVPFRLRREFKTVERYSSLLGEGPSS